MLSPRSSLTRRVLIAALLFAPALFSSEPGTVLRGHLDPQSVKASTEPDQALTFVTNSGQKYQVSGDSISNAQLRDPQLLEREWELQGSLGSDGRLEIARLYTIKDGQRYRVTYYCEICNITTHQPGRCMCCQGPTELREVPEK